MIYGQGPDLRQDTTGSKDQGQEAEDTVHGARRTEAMPQGACRGLFCMLLEAVGRHLVGGYVRPAQVTNRMRRDDNNGLS